MMASLVKIELVVLTLAVVQQLATATQCGSMFLAFPVHCTMPPNQAASCLLQGGQHPQRDDYTYLPGIGGYKLHTRALPWVEARVICEEEGGHLAIINSITESKAIASFYQRSKPIVGSSLPTFAGIGFHDLYREGEYVTIHGQSLSKAGFDQWGNGQPDNIGQGEDCGSVDKDGLLNDIGCNIPIGFICEVPASPMYG